MAPIPLGSIVCQLASNYNLSQEDFDCDNGDIEIDNDDTKMYLVWLLGSKSSCDQFFVGFRVTTDDGL